MFSLRFCWVFKVQHSLTKIYIFSCRITYLFTGRQCEPCTWHHVFLSVHGWVTACSLEKSAVRRYDWVFCTGKPEGIFNGQDIYKLFLTLSPRPPRVWSYIQTCNFQQGMCTTKVCQVLCPETLWPSTEAQWPPQNRLWEFMEPSASIQSSEGLHQDVHCHFYAIPTGSQPQQWYQIPPQAIALGPLLSWMEETYLTDILQQIFHLLLTDASKKERSLSGEAIPSFPSVCLENLLPQSFPLVLNTLARECGKLPLSGSSLQGPF